MSSIELDPEKGVNPFLTYCPRCHNEGPELMLVGRRQYYDKCIKCKLVALGGKPRNGKCPTCEVNNGWTRHKIADGDRLPSSDVCDNCKEQIEQVRNGGVFIACEDCDIIGAVKAGVPFAMEVRKAHGLDVPKREHHCDSCQHTWTADVERFAGTTNLSGEKSQHCPKCLKKASSSSPHIWEACGVKFTKKDCPGCGPDAEAHRAAQEGGG